MDVWTTTLVTAVATYTPSVLAVMYFRGRLNYKFSHISRSLDIPSVLTALHFSGCLNYKFSHISHCLNILSVFTPLHFSGCLDYKLSHMSCCLDSIKSVLTTRHFSSCLDYIVSFRRILLPELPQLYLKLGLDEVIIVNQELFYIHTCYIIIYLDNISSAADLTARFFILVAVCTPLRVLLARHFSDCSD
ncbi:hypothetical protein TNCV_4514631 [Trichonephila clavipes]|nr:hypothetical protein TNCV_4514631 [Trichonephila clavipes]